MNLPIPSATVILLRDDPGPLEVYLVRRHGKSGFMAGAYVFPGGKLDPSDGGDGRVGAARELCEEAGVLCARGATPDDVAAVRGALAGKQALAEALAARGLALDGDSLVEWARWITPSFEPRRFDARFYVARLPPGQTPARDDRETTDAAWFAPRAALDAQSRGEIRLPPPTVKNLEELAAHERVDEVIAAARARAPHLAPIMPRMKELDGTFALLLPWDPDYAAAPGEGEALPAGHALAAGGGSRIVLCDGKWVTR